MPPKRKIHLSPLATHVLSSQRILRPNYRAEQKVDPAEYYQRQVAPQRVPGEYSARVFTFGKSTLAFSLLLRGAANSHVLSAASSFTFVSPRHSLNEAVPPTTVVRGALGSASPVPPPGSDIRSPGSGDSSPRAHGTNKCLPTDTSLGDDLMDVATPTFPNSRTLGLDRINYTCQDTGGSVGGDTIEYNSVESTTNFVFPPPPLGKYSCSTPAKRITAHIARYPTACKSVPIAEDCDEERSELSYVSYENLAPSPPAGRGVQVSGRPSGLGWQTVPSLRIEEVASLNQNSPSATPNEHLHTPCNNADGTPVVDEGPRISANLPGCTRSANVTDNPINNLNMPTRDQTPVRAPSTPPRRILVRGAFIIGNGAPIRIDESIEVRLRDSVGGHIDFII